MLFLNAFQFTVLNALPLSIRGRASMLFFSNRKCMVCTATSQLASFPTHTWSDPAEKIMSSSRAGTYALPYMSQSTFTAPIGHSPRFLQSVIDVFTRYVSKLLNQIFSGQWFLIRLAIVFYKDVGSSPNCLIVDFVSKHQRLFQVAWF